MITHDRGNAGLINKFAGKNYMRNPDLSVWQRGDVAAGNGFLSVDGWTVVAGASEAVEIKKNRAPTGHTVNGNSGSVLKIDNSMTVKRTSSVGNTATLRMMIEGGITKLVNGEGYTVSFYAFGSGGMVDKFIKIDICDKFNVPVKIKPGWNRYAVPMSDPNGVQILQAINTLNGNAWVDFDISGLPVTPNAIDLTGFKLEKGLEATEFEIPDLDLNYIQCQRYFQRLNWSGQTNQNLNTGVAFTSVILPVKMMKEPSFTRIYAQDGRVNGLLARPDRLLLKSMNVGYDDVSFHLSAEM